MRTLIADPTLLDATLATLEPGVTTDGGWTREYSDPSTGSTAPARSGELPRTTRRAPADGARRRL